MKLLNLNEANIIGIHCMAMIAASGENGITVKRISELTNCSKNHLSKLMEKFVKAGLVYATRGQLGRFFMKKASEKVLLIDIIEAVTGEIDYSEDACPLTKNYCKGAGYMMNGICKEIADEYISYLRKTTLADIKGKAEKILEQTYT